LLDWTVVRQLLNILLALAGCCIASVATGGNPLAVSATMTIDEAIVECAID